MNQASDIHPSGGDPPEAAHPQPMPGRDALQAGLRATSLRTGFGWSLLGNIIFGASQWLLLVILAKLGTQAMLGEFSYALALSAPIIVLTGLQLRAVQATDMADRFSFQTYFALRVVGALLAIAIVATIAWMSPVNDIHAAVIAVAVAKAIEAMSDVCYGFMQRHERMDLIARSTIGRGLASTAAFAAGLWATGTVAGGAVAIAGAWAFVLIVHDVPHATALLGARRNEAWRHPRIDSARLLEGVRLAAPLGFVLFLVNLNANIPRYFIEHALGLSDLGVFSAVTYVTVAGGVVVGSMGQTVMPRLALYHSRGEQAAVSRLSRMIASSGAALGLAVAVVAGVAGKPLLAILYRPEYASAQPVFLWAGVASAITFASSALGYTVTAMRNFRAQVPLALIVTGINAASCWALIPKFGLLGGVGATALSSGAQLIGYMLLIRFAHLPRHRSRWV